MKLRYRNTFWMLFLNVMLLNNVVLFVKVVVFKHLTGPFTSVQSRYLLQHPGLLGWHEKSKINLCWLYVFQWRRMSWKEARKSWGQFWNTKWSRVDSGALWGLYRITDVLSNCLFYLLLYEFTCQSFLPEVPNQYIFVIICNSNLHLLDVKHSKIQFS